MDFPGKEVLPGTGFPGHEDRVVELSIPKRESTRLSDTHRPADDPRRPGTITMRSQRSAVFFDADTCPQRTGYNTHVYSGLLLSTKTNENHAD
jgi:hypothetical protein